MQTINIDIHLNLLFRLFTLGRYWAKLHFKIDENIIYLHAQVFYSVWIYLFKSIFIKDLFLNLNV